MRQSTLNKFLLILLLSVIFMFSGAQLLRAESGPAFIRQKLSRVEKIWPGQSLILYVTLYVSTSFSGSTRFALPEVSGVLVMENEDRPLLGTEMVEGKSYIFKRHEIIILPLQPGAHTIPHFAVEFSLQKDQDKIAEQGFTTSSFDINVLAIPGVTARDQVITATDLQINDRWQPNLRSPQAAAVRVGDALTRTITLTAQDLPGMALPPLAVKKVGGLGFYRKAPQVEDQRNRGAFTGRRTETITYICEESGKFRIPGLSLKWWNPISETLQKLSLPEVTVKVTSNPLLQKEGQVAAPAAEAAVFPWIEVTLLLIFSALVFVIFRFFWSKNKFHIAKTEAHEKELFMKFQKVAATWDAKATMLALLAWLDQSKNGGISSTLEHFYTRVGDPELKKEIDLLENFLYAVQQEQKWSGKKLAAAVQRARKNLNRRQSRTNSPGLPSLNP